MLTVRARCRGGEPARPWRSPPAVFCCRPAERAAGAGRAPWRPDLLNPSDRGASQAGAYASAGSAHQRPRNTHFSGKRVALALVENIDDLQYMWTIRRARLACRQPARFPGVVWALGRSGRRHGSGGLRRAGWQRAMVGQASSTRGQHRRFRDHMEYEGNCPDRHQVHAPWIEAQVTAVEEEWADRRVRTRRSA